MVGSCGTGQLLLQLRPFLLRCGKSGLKPRIKERRVTRSGTVEAADAWSESSTEVSATGLDKVSGCDNSELRMTTFCLQAPARAPMDLRPI